MNALARRLAALAAAAIAGSLAAAAPALADLPSRDAIVPSFDGAPLIVTLHPAAGLQPGQRAPTILQTHGWAGTRETNPDAASDETTGNVGVGPLRRAGFNVLTWDSRGFGDSGGVVEVDAPDAEGRDVQALLSWLAQQPEARLDGPGDPRAGMEGVSYAGGIELVAAGLDKRIDAIAPTIAWHSLLTSLYPQELVKGGWAGLLYAAGVPSATGEGLDSPAGPQTGGLDPHITSAFGSGASTGQLSPEDRAWFASRGPGDLVKQITAPTLLVQGTADTLFTLDEAITNLHILKADGVPSKMVWFCGGHGVCLTGHGPDGHVEADVIAWMRHYLAGDTGVATGPGFEWLADDAVWRSAPTFPVRHGAPLTGDGSGTLAVNPADALSGTPIAAGPAVNAIDVPIAARPAQVVGRPVLRMTYTATGTGPGHVFAQIVDDTRHLALGNQVTPIHIALDGAQHTITRRLDAVAASVAAGSRYTLQIVGGSQVYGPTRTTGAVTVGHVHVALPTLAAAAQAKPPARRRSRPRHALLPAGARCGASGLDVRLREPGGHATHHVRVAARRGRARLARRNGHRHVLVQPASGAHSVRIGVRARAAGVRYRDARTYATCFATGRG